MGPLLVPVSWAPIGPLVVVRTLPLWRLAVMTPLLVVSVPKQVALVV